MQRFSIWIIRFFIIFLLWESANAAFGGNKNYAKPIAHIRESIICCPLDSVVFDGWASIVVRSEIVSWIWDFNGDGVTDTTCKTGDVKIMAPKKPYSYCTILKVQDKNGFVSEPDTVIFHIMNAPPTAKLGPDTTISAGQRVFFSPVVVSHCSTPIKFEWDFNDDGTFEYDSKDNGETSIIYKKRGRYYARFRVTDNLGRTTGGIRIVNVK